MNLSSLHGPGPQYRPDAARTKVTFEVDARSLPAVDSVSLKGSFDPTSGTYDAAWNEGKGLPMRDDGEGGDRVAGDGIYTRQVELKGPPGSEFQWGAVDGNGRYLVTTENNPVLKLSASPEQTERLAPLQLGHYGLQEREGKATVTTWSPTAAAMSLELYGPDGQKLEEIPMTRPEGHPTDWRADLGKSKAQLEGYSYLLKEQDPEGKESRYIDPFARKLVGQQRGLERIFVDPIGGFETGWYDDSGSGGPNYTDNPQMGRFSVDGQHGAEQMYVVLKDQQGRPLTREQLLERLGPSPLTSYENARPEDRRDFDVLTAWQLHKSPGLEPYIVSDEITPDGRIPLRRLEEATGDGGWVGVVHNFAALQGLRYEFHAEAGGKLVADRNGDGQLDTGELARTPYNDPENTISPRPGSARRALISTQTYQPRYQDTPRIESDPLKHVIYEAHVGSLLAAQDNGLPATFEDLEKRLDYVLELGATALELMPTAEFGGKKDWGYTNDHYFAGADAYGFTMPVERAREEGLVPADSDHAPGEEVRIDGTEALKWFVDKAHQRGLTVYGDVVYNHTSGKPDGDNPLSAIGGENSDFFRWGDGHFKETPWGRKPDFEDPFVKQFFTDHAAQQITEYGFDGLRFDFTQVLHNTGSAHEKNAGMEALRQIQRGLELVKPGVFTVAEDFSNDPLVASPLEWQNHNGEMLRKGMGFDAVWAAPYRDSIYEFIKGRAGSADNLLGQMQGHHGVPGTGQMLTYSHSHDEVGNSGKWIGRLAAGTKSEDGVLSDLARSKARSSAALTLLAPGIAMLWQGEEFLGNNDFKHGLTSTWGADTSWLDGTPEQKATPASRARQGHFKVHQDLIKLRRSSDAFEPHAPVLRTYSHNDDKVSAFERQGKSGDRFIVISHMSEADKADYTIPLPEGQWREVLNTDAEVYGGEGFGNAGGTFSGQAALNLPAGGTIVLQRV
jgi:maltooligosyltrehalose trehalohydrolase